MKLLWRLDIFHEGMEVLFLSFINRDKTYSASKYIITSYRAVSLVPAEH